MKHHPNKLKKKLKEGKVVFGTCINVFSPNLVELAGFCGLDFCRIDNEHTWRQDESMDHMMRAAAVGDIVALPRIDRGNPFLIRKVCEIGAKGFIIPDIQGSKEVKEIIEAAKFPPLGNRGYSGNCFSAGYGTKGGEDWIQWSNQELLIGVMIEDPGAVEDINKIMSLEGLDFVLFGPSDYSLNIGLPGPNKNHPKVQEALKKTIKAAKANDKYVMIGVGFPWDKEAQKYIEMGCQMIEIGHDYSLLRTVWSNTISNIVKNS
jgi:2-keto-3-deoxy-L-rhamnonate aldolase RhmA